MKRKIYFVQTDILRSNTLFFTAYLPYAVGQIWAYALESETVSNNYELKEFLFLREKPDEVAARLDAPFLIGFSCYVWNTEYNKALAKAVKARFPDCLILFGGHNVPPGDAFLREHDFIDYLIHGEGEIPIRELLCELSKDTPDFKRVPGLSWRKGHDGYGTNAATYLESLDDLPSPYLKGLFDNIYKANPKIQWSTVWETNRGCPYQCAYCDWAMLQSKIRCLSMERLMKEIRWLGDHKVEFILGADSNFGFFQRDEELIDAIVAEHERSGYPYKYYVNYAKHSGDRVYRIVTKLNAKGMAHYGTTLSLQSLSPVVLKNIGRENLNPEYFTKLLRRYAKEGIKCYSEFILGLPGETFESFRQGIAKLIEMGQHSLIRVYHCYLLPNSRLAQEMRDTFNPKTIRTLLLQPYADKSTEEKDEIPEYLETIVSTDTLDDNDWLMATCFYLNIQAMHCYGLMRFIAIYLHEQGVGYDEFYYELLKWYMANPQTVCGEMIAKMKNYYILMQQGKAHKHFKLERISQNRFSEDEGVYATCCLDLAKFYEEVSQFLKPYFKNEELFYDLLNYQKEMVRLPNIPQKKITISYDYPNYFQAIYEGRLATLEKKHITLQLADDKNPKNWAEWQDITLPAIKGSAEAMYYNTKIVDGNFHT